MNKNKVILASSFVLLGAVIVFLNSSQNATSASTKVEDESISTSVIETPQKTQATQIVPTKSDETTEAPTISQEVFQTQEQPKYILSELPQNMSVAIKKERFEYLLIPAIEKIDKELEDQYNRIKQLLQEDPNNIEILNLMKEYKAKNSDDLLRRLKPHSKSLAIAQAAIQSGWATSRFTLIAKNLFGVWSFDENEPRVQANETRDGKIIYLKKYDSLESSVKDYYKLLATSDLFEEFRNLKMQTSNPYELMEKLNNYYREGDDFTTSLGEVIRFNNLEQYDK
jgi:Bax protein